MYRCVFGEVAYNTNSWWNLEKVPPGLTRRELYPWDIGGDRPKAAVGLVWNVQSPTRMTDSDAEVPRIEECILVLQACGR